MCELTPYPGKVWLFTNRRKYNEAVQIIGCDPTDNDCVGLTQHVQQQLKVASKDIWIVGVFDGSCSTLVHELAHVVLGVMKMIGMSPHGGNGEPFCYLLDHLFTILCPHLRRRS